MADLELNDGLTHLIVSLHYAYVTFYIISLAKWTNRQ